MNLVYCFEMNYYIVLYSIVGGIVFNKCFIIMRIMKFILV